jgi:hypothetical protein
MGGDVLARGQIREVNEMAKWDRPIFVPVAKIFFLLVAVHPGVRTSGFWNDN